MSNPFDDYLSKSFGPLFGQRESVPIQSLSEEDLEERRRARGNVHVRFYEGGPEIDLGVTGPELLSGALKTLGSLAKKVKPEFVSPILSRVLERIRKAEKEAARD